MCKTALLVFLTVLVASPAFATVNHGTFLGASVTFRDVSETTQSPGDPEPLWVAPGALPLVFGDQLLFFPLTFGATATGGASDDTSSLLTMQIEGSGPLNTIDLIELTEHGNAVLSGTGAAATSASASLSGTVTIIEDVNGPIAPVVIPFTATFAPKASYDLPTDPGTTLWSGSFVVDVASQVPYATVALLSLDNSLSASSETSSSATIQKMVASGPVITIGVLRDCGLEIDKTCCVPQPPAPGVDDCEGQVIRAVFEYTGGPCGATTNDQSGKVKCSGDLIGSPAGITVTKHADKIVASPSSGIGVGDTVTFYDTSVEGVLKAETKFEVAGPDGTQSLSLHTSCSRALNVGDQFGSMKLVELETTLGGIVTLGVPGPGDTSCVAPGFPEGTPCDSKLTEIVFEYLGSACQDPLPNPQSGEAECSGDATGAVDVGILYTGKYPDKITVEPASNINDGDIVRVTATGRDDLWSKTPLKILDMNDGVLQSVEIHTSCSQPLALGDVFGSLRVVGFTTKEGGSKDLPDPDALTVFDACVVPLAPPAPHCTQMVQELHLAYIGDLLGDGCAVSNDQDGLASCAGVDDPGSNIDDPDTTADEGDQVSITITGDPVDVAATPNSGVRVGDIFVLAHSAGKLADDTAFDVTGPNGTQSIQIHTSCSKPLNLGDRFGSVAVAGIERGDGDLDDLDGDDGFVGLGGQVEYQYQVTNQGLDLVTDVSVQDDVFGPIASGEALDPGETQTFFTTRTLFSSHTNTGVVGGEVDGEQCLPAHDQVDVTVTLPPHGPFDCSTPIASLTMIWQGVETIDVRAWSGDVGSTVAKEVENLAFDSELTVGGLSGVSDDVVWEIFEGGTMNSASPVKLGESKFHLSCSDPDMNGIADCGRGQGNGKHDDPLLINDWVLEGMVDSDETLNCTPAEIAAPGGGSCGIGVELLLVLPGLMWLQRRRQAS